jgi:YidC/Oxa1 family membrane protein insertase
LAEFRNPQNEPGMEKRLLLVFALTFLVIVLFQPLLKKYLPQPPAPPAQNQSQAQPQVQVQPQAQSIVADHATAAHGKPANSAATKQAAAESETIVENDLYRITFTNRGGQVKSWVLKKYDDEKGRPLELVNGAAAAKYGCPLSLWSYDEMLRNKLNSALYVVSASGRLTAPAEISFEYADPEITVRKRFRFDDTYVVQLETAVVAGDRPVTALPAWPAGFGDQATSAAFHSGQVEYQNNNDTQRLAIKKISGGATVRGPLDWAGVTESYFAAVFLPADSQGANLILLRNSIDVPKDPQKPTETTPADVLGVAVGNPAGPSSERVYVGPKSLQVLESIPVPAIDDAPKDLRALVDFGFFGVIARPLFIWLRWTYLHWVGNWGWALLIQTVIIAIALLPLRVYQMRSSLKMQKIQPQIKAIQEKYKKYGMRDPRKQDMNKEVWELQQKEGVNMWGGCLPMLIQLPFLWAYYKMLSGAIDLRHASWLWIHDLSARDPYFILPIAMVLSMIATTRLTPQAGIDPSQQKMMNWTMPLMMGFIFYNLPAGLNLYYAASNVISGTQQLVMNRTSLGQEMREIAQKRARKKGK